MILVGGYQNHESKAFKGNYPKGDWPLKIDLEHLETTVPKGMLPLTKDFDLENGGFIGRNGGNISCVDPDANSEKVVQLGHEVNLIRAGSDVWFHGPQLLQKISLRDCKLDNKNYFENKGLTTINAISYALGDYLRLDGNQEIDGLPGSVWLNSFGDIALSRPMHDVQIEHPIELKWNK